MKLAARAIGAKDSVEGAKTGSMVLSEYELQRAANMEKNKAELVSLGLEDAVTACRKPKKPTALKRPREEKPREPTRGSRRLAGEAAEESTLDPEALDRLLENDERPVGGDPLKRASRAARLTPEQSARLDALEETSAGPLTDEEVSNLAEVRKYIAGNNSGNWRVHQAKGTSLWEEKRQNLKDAAEMYEIRWPTWLADIEKAPFMRTSKKDDARHQTMFAIERAACGLGLDYHGWPEGVGVLLANEELAPDAEPPRPRILTLGSDTEMLKREGQRLEFNFGRDAGNGWVYNHALGKLRKYQVRWFSHLSSLTTRSCCCTRKKNQCRYLTVTLPLPYRYLTVTSPLPHRYRYRYRYRYLLLAPRAGVAAGREVWGDAERRLDRGP